MMTLWAIKTECGGTRSNEIGISIRLTAHVERSGGEGAVCCSSDLKLVGGVVAAATNRWLPAFFE